MGASKHIKKSFEREYSGKDKELWKHYKDKLIQWRKEKVVTRVERPTNPVRARKLGYKAKQGFVIARIKIKKGSRFKHRVRRGRRPKRSGVRKIKPGKSLQAIAEQRTARRFPNLEVLNSYWVGEDGTHKFFEVILVDTKHPSIKADKDINWICKQRRRVYTGKTSVGRKGRGLR